MDNKEKTSCNLKTSIGGQALLEGIMMRGPQKTSMAVRRPDGSIFVETGDTVMSRSKLAKIPVLRGVAAFVSSMAAGYRALMRSAEIAMPELDGEENKPASAAEKSGGQDSPECAAPESEEAPEVTPAPETVPAESVETAQSEEAEGAEPAGAENSGSTGPEKEPKPVPAAKEKEKNGQMTVIMIISLVLGLALSLFLFKVIPESVYELFCRLFPSLREGGWSSNFIRSLITGVLKIMILIGYMAAVSLMKDIKRTFMYHGAEHKTIFCFERGLPLTVENVKSQRRFHPRCGTSFLVLSVLVSVFFTMFIPARLVENVVLNVLARTGISLLLLPVIMGFGYELIRVAGRHDNLFTRIVSAPGVWLQHITTKEPDDGMIECAITALSEVIPEVGSDRL
ncbi:MAG: DUF1385 domain-containing protein [Clostridia bacterium]|nr:DUF1385 domain-containing protein [Clostridia bacterium]